MLWGRLPAHLANELAVNYYCYCGWCRCCYVMFCYKWIWGTIWYGCHFRHTISSQELFNDDLLSISDDDDDACGDLALIYGHICQTNSKINIVAYMANGEWWSNKLIIYLHWFALVGLLFALCFFLHQSTFTSEMVVMTILFWMANGCRIKSKRIPVATQENTRKIIN